MVRVTISLGLGLQLLFDHQAYLSCVTTCSFELPKGRSYNIHVSNQCIHTPLVSYILDHDVRLILFTFFNINSTTLIKVLIFSHLCVTSILDYFSLHWNQCGLIAF